MPGSVVLRKDTQVIELEENFVDAFCGAGGFTWGWSRAGFTPTAGIDDNSAALRTHEANFGSTHCLLLNKDLQTVPVREICRMLGLRRAGVFAVIGGPPCQGWSKVGRGKLRSLKKASIDLLNDPRNKLYRFFIELIDYLKPAVCVMENVPGMLSIQGRNIADVVKANMENAGFQCSYALVDAHWFAVPQDRKRLIFMGSRSDLDLGLDPSELKDFAGSFVKEKLCIPPRTNVAAAIRDLPPILNGEDSEPTLYRRPPGCPSAYSRLMRAESNGLITDHICRRYNDQDVEAFGVMSEGMKYRDLPERFKRYRDDIFPDKYKKLAWADRSWTVTAHLGKDCYTHIHPAQARTISIREAARLQSFPDNFRFFGNMGDRFRQIGNAVPPFMAWGIAEYIKSKAVIERSG